MNSHKGHPSTSNAPASREAHLATLIERLLLDRFAPASVVVNVHGDIMYFHGHTGAYLELTPGEQRHNVLDMAREGLRIELASALRECATQGVDVTRTDIQIKTNGECLRIDLTVAKVNEPEAIRGLLLITFRPTPPTAHELAKAKQPLKKSGDVSIEQALIHELRTFA